MQLVEKILAVLKIRRMTMKELADASGVPYNTVRSYAKPGSQRVPTAPVGIALAKVLQVPVEWLFSNTAEMPPPARFEPPPFEIQPWPPNGITWNEVQAAIAAFVYQRLIDQHWIAGMGRSKLSRGTEELRNIRPDEFDAMSDSPSAIWGRIRALQAEIEQMKQQQRASPAPPRKAESSTRPAEPAARKGTQHHRKPR